MLRHAYCPETVPIRFNSGYGLSEPHGLLLLVCFLSILPVVAAAVILLLQFIYDDNVWRDNLVFHPTFSSLVEQL